MSHLVVAWLFDVSFVILKLCHILEDVPQCCCIVHNSLRLLGFSFFCMVPDCLCPGPASLGQTRIKQTPLIVLNTQIDFFLIPVIWNIDLFLLLCVLCLIPAFLRPCDILIPDRLCFVCYSFVDSTDATKYRFQGGKNCKCICNIYIYIYIYTSIYMCIDVITLGFFSIAFEMCYIFGKSSKPQQAWTSKCQMSTESNWTVKEL